MTRVVALGHLGFEVSQLARWRTLAGDLLGLGVGEQGPDGAVPLRMDTQCRRINLHPGAADDLAYVGWAVADDHDLGLLVDRLRAAGVVVAKATPEDAALRSVETLFRCVDPSGIPTELYCGAALSAQPFASPVVASGFVAAELGLGHLVVGTDDPAAAQAFYCDLLGLRVSDRIELPGRGSGVLRLVFLRANARHHSIGLAARRYPKRLHHFMLEVGSLDDVGRAHDRCQNAGIRITQTLGRHSNDRMVSFYAETPSGFAFEIGWGGRLIDGATSDVATFDTASDWGHRRP